MVQQVICDWYFRDECSGGEGPCLTGDNPPQDPIAGAGSSVGDNSTDLCCYHSFLFSSEIFI